MNIAIAGVGYVGIVTAACLASKGHKVVCYDYDKYKIDKINDTKSPLILEKGLSELLKENWERLSFVSDYSLAYKDKDVVFVTVGTPEKKDGSANLKYVYSAVHQIAENVNKECVICVKSTVPIGTNDKIEKLANTLCSHNIKIHVASNPEFLSQGTAVCDTLNATRIVIGTNDDFSKRILSELYKDFNCPKVYTDRMSSEMIKYASNDFLALKISYVNELANLCEEIGADIDDVTNGMGFDNRIGNKFLRAGIGYGGSCFPKDTKALHWLSGMHDCELKTVKAAIEVNDLQKLKLIKKARKYYSDFKDLKVAILGLTFKPETDDLREAPALVSIPILLEDGAEIYAYDPVAKEKISKLYPEVTCVDSIENALKDAEICLIFTEWKEIKCFKISEFAKLMKVPIIIDGRNCFDICEIEKENVIYESIGRKIVGKLRESI